MSKLIVLLLFFYPYNGREERERLQYVIVLADIWLMNSIIRMKVRLQRHSTLVTYNTPCIFETKSGIIAY